MLREAAKPQSGWQQEWLKSSTAEMSLEPTEEELRTTLPFPDKIWGFEVMCRSRYTPFGGNLRVPDAAHHEIALVFIINGQDFRIEIDLEARLIGAVELALAESGNTGRRDPREWEVRDSSGVLLEVDRTIAHLGLKNGARLFLSLKVGAGGCTRPCA